MELDLMTAKEAAEVWGITTRRVQALCVNGQIPDATRLGRMWVMPKSTFKPPDGRTTNGRCSKNDRRNANGEERS